MLVISIGSCNTYIYIYIYIYMCVWVCCLIERHRGARFSIEQYATFCFVAIGKPERARFLKDKQ